MEPSSDFDDVPGLVSTSFDGQGHPLADGDDPTEPSTDEEPTLPPGCGDGIIQRDEACDDGNDFDRDGCTTWCEIDRCGDGKLQPTEQCDDGNPAVTDGCTPVCLLERGGCRPREHVQCNTGEEIAFERLAFDADVTDVVDEYLGGLIERDSEYTISFAATADMSVRVSVDDEFEVYVVETSAVGCIPGSLLGNGDEATFEAEALVRYELVVEGVTPRRDGRPVHIDIECGS